MRKILRKILGKIAWLLWGKRQYRKQNAAWELNLSVSQETFSESIRCGFLERIDKVEQLAGMDIAAFKNQTWVSKKDLNPTLAVMASRMLLYELVEHLAKKNINSAFSYGGTLEWIPERQACFLQVRVEAEKQEGDG